jgi:hypothetical protein
MSMTSEPFLMPSATPFSPKMAVLTCGPFGTIVMTSSHFSATSFAVRAPSAPSDMISSTAWGTMS